MMQTANLTTSVGSPTVDQHLILGLPDAAIGSITAAVIVGIVGLLTLITTKEQKTSEFRQAWIDAVREDLACFMSGVNSLRDIDRMDKDADKHWELAGPYYDMANKALFRLKLRLNPAELPCQEMINTMTEIEQQFTFGVDPSASKLAGLEHKLVIQSQRVLKAEWMRVRDGEITFRVAKWVFAVLIAVFAGAFLLGLQHAS